jgi:hypothetical protein
MGSIAERRSLRVLATTKINGGGFLGAIFHRLQSSALMTTVAKGLFLTETARTPPIALTLRDLYAIRRLLRYYWIGHGSFPSLIATLYAKVNHGMVSSSGGIN